MAICLLFMSELPTRDHHLNSIEHNLRKIFPPSTHGNSPDDYKDFQATAVRSVFNLETAQNVQFRLWDNVRRGHWRNTVLGNEYAVQALSRNGITIELRGELLTSQLPLIPKRGYSTFALRAPVTRGLQSC